MAELLYGLRHYGKANPLSQTQLEEAEAQAKVSLPTSFKHLLATWGPGWMCSEFDVRNPWHAEPVGAGDGFYQRQRTPTSFQRTNRQAWLGIDKETWDSLVFFAAAFEDIRDPIFLAWRTASGLDKRGEYPIWLLRDRERHGTLIANSFDELVSRLLDGSFDVLHPPGDPPGRWGFPASYHTQVESAAQLDAIRASHVPALVTSLEAGDEKRAEALLDELFAQRTGRFIAFDVYNALRSPSADRIPASLRGEWLERLQAVYRRNFVSENPVSTRLTEALLEGRAAEDALAIEVAPLDLPHALSLRLSWRRDQLLSTVRGQASVRLEAKNTGATPLGPLTLLLRERDTMPGAPSAHRIVELLPGASCESAPSTTLRAELDLHAVAQGVSEAQALEALEAADRKPVAIADMIATTSDAGLFAKRARCRPGSRGASGRDP